MKFGRFPTKLWGTPNAVGESEVRALELTDLPYATISGDGFVARKKGLFREVTALTTSKDKVMFRAVDCYPDSAGVPKYSDGSVRTYFDIDAGTHKTKRGVDNYYHTADWVSADGKYVVTWCAAGRYANVGASSLATTANFWPGELRKNYEGAFGGAHQIMLPNLYINGKKYGTGTYVLGACVVMMEASDGTTKPFVKLILTDAYSPSYIGVADTSGYRLPSHYVITPLDDFMNTANKDYKRVAIRASMLAVMGVSTYAMNSSVVHAANPYLFNASGTEAVCNVFMPRILGNDTEALSSYYEITNGRPTVIHLDCAGTDTPTTTVYSLTTTSLSNFVSGAEDASAWSLVLSDYVSTSGAAYEGLLVADFVAGGDEMLAVSISGSYTYATTVFSAWKSTTTVSHPAENTDVYVTDRQDVARNVVEVNSSLELTGDVQLAAGYSYSDATYSESGYTQTQQRTGSGADLVMTAYSGSDETTNTVVGSGSKTVFFLPMDLRYGLYAKAVLELSSTGSSKSTTTSSLSGSTTTTDPAVSRESSSTTPTLMHHSSALFVAPNVWSMSATTEGEGTQTSSGGTFVQNYTVAVDPKKKVLVAACFAAGSGSSTQTVSEYQSVFIMPDGTSGSLAPAGHAFLDFCYAHRRTDGM